jgi:hypothetical protein
MNEQFDIVHYHGIDGCLAAYLLWDNQKTSRGAQIINSSKKSIIRDYKIHINKNVAIIGLPFDKESIDYLTKVTKHLLVINSSDDLIIEDFNDSFIHITHNATCTNIVLGLYNIKYKPHIIIADLFVLDIHKSNYSDRSLAFTFMFNDFYRLNKIHGHLPFMKLKHFFKSGINNIIDEGFNIVNTNLNIIKKNIYNPGIIKKECVLLDYNKYTILFMKVPTNSFAFFELLNRAFIKSGIDIDIFIFLLYQNKDEIETYNKKIELKYGPRPKCSNFDPLKKINREVNKTMYSHISLRTAKPNINIGNITQLYGGGGIDFAGAFDIPFMINCHELQACMHEKL